MLAALIKNTETLTKMMQDFREENEKLKSELRSVAATSTSSAEESGEDKYKKKFEVLLKINRAWEDEHSRLKMRYQTLDVEKRQLECERGSFSEHLYRLERRDAFLQSEIKRLNDIAVIQDGIIGRYSAKINSSLLKDMAAKLLLVFVMFILSLYRHLYFEYRLRVTP